MSMMQEAQQELIRESVYIDKLQGRAVAKLPFLTSPVNKLKDNSRLAERRLESVCKKYSKDEKVVDMIDKAFKKLFSNSHIVLVDELSGEIKKKIMLASPSYTIPWDIAFKTTSLSTPARPVFDAGCKTPGGESLNNLLAKGVPDMVSGLNDVLCTCIRAGTLIGHA